MRKEMEEVNAAKGAGSHSGSLHSFRTRDGHTSEFLLFKPPNAQTQSPLVVLVYGGGFVTGAKADMAPLAMALSSNFGATVVCPEYRLAPEHKFPTAPNDLWDFMTWLAENVSLTGSDPTSGFVIGGVSAGGNLAAVLASKVLAPEYPFELTGAFFGIPVFFNEETVPSQYRDVFLSREQNAEAKILDGEALRLIEGYYQMDWASPDFCPIFNPKGLANHPKTYFQVAGQDPLRDDGLIYEQILRAQGVPTRIDVYPGLPHGFNGVLPHLKASKTANEDLIRGFAWLLEKSSS